MISEIERIRLEFKEATRLVVLLEAAKKEHQMHLDNIVKQLAEQREIQNRAVQLMRVWLET